MATDSANPDEQPSPVVEPDSETPSESPATPSSGEPSQQHAPKTPKIAIGSQRDVADKSPALPKAVEAAKANPVQIAEPAVESPEPEIGSMIGLGDDLDAEIEAALRDVSMESIVDSTNATENDLAPNARVKGTVTRIHGDNVFFKLMGQYEGVASLNSFKSPPTVDELVEVIVRGQNAEDGLYDVAIPGSSIDVSDWEDLNEGDVVECRVTGSNTGGLEVSVNSLRGFIPASQIDRFRVENFGDYVNQKLQCVVMELNPNRRKLVLSRSTCMSAAPSPSMSTKTLNDFFPVSS